MPPLEPTLQTRLEAFIDFKVKHPRLEEMDQDLMQRISGRRRYTILAVFGATGVGKSTVMQLERRNRVCGICHCVAHLLGRGAA